MRADSALCPEDRLPPHRGGPCPAWRLWQCCPRSAGRSRRLWCHCLRHALLDAIIEHGAQKLLRRDFGLDEAGIAAQIRTLYGRRQQRRSSLRCIMTERRTARRCQNRRRSCAGDEVELCMSRSTERTRGSARLATWPGAESGTGPRPGVGRQNRGQRAMYHRAGTQVEPQAVITRLGNVRAMSVGVEKSWQRRWRHSPSTSANVSPWMWARQREGLPIVSCKLEG